MTYEMKVIIYNPETPEGMLSDLFFTIDCTFTHDPSDYGNGYYCYLKLRKADGFANYLDLRYDKTFNPSEKIAFLEKWARGYWHGTNGAYAIKDIQIREAE